jgi:putative aminopeptidase FrvX
MKNYKPRISLLKLNRFKKILLHQAESTSKDQQLVIGNSIIDMYNEVHPHNPLKVEIDDIGNFYIIKGEANLYPCVVAHLDQVHQFHFNYRIVQDGDILRAESRKTEHSKWVSAGTGSDDLTGCWTCLESLIEFDNIKVALFQDEEIGCIGSGRCDIDFFKDCAFILQADRNQATKDFLNYTNGIRVTTDEFDKASLEIIQKYGYSFNHGVYTDVGELVERGAGCCGVNIACGYHKAHSSKEYSSITESFTCLNLMFDVIKNMSYKRWEISVERDYYSYYSGWDYYEDVPKKKEKKQEEEERKDMCPHCKIHDLLEVSDWLYCDYCGYFRSVYECRYN